MSINNSLRDAESSAELVAQGDAVDLSREPRSVLTINGGSSSIKCALYQIGERIERGLYGKIDRIGLSGTNVTFKDSTGKSLDTRTIDLDDHPSAVALFLKWLESQQCFALVKAVGVPRNGFHGLSYEFVMAKLVRLGDPAATTGRVILAQLGNGASLAAVRDGKSIDTSMGFTPTSKLVMSSRSCDLNPGLVSNLARTEQMNATQVQEKVNGESALLEVAEISSDLRDVLALEADDVRAAEALAPFCYQTKKWIGSFAAALGGLNTLAFAGGVGANSPPIRTRICDGLGFLGLELDEARNTDNASLMSTDSGRVAVRVIRTDEELMIARSVIRVLGLGVPNER